MKDTNRTRLDKYSVMYFFQPREIFLCLTYIFLHTKKVLFTKKEAVSMVFISLIFLCYLKMK